MSLIGVEGVTARNSIFRNGSFGVESLDSAPGLIANRFENNLTAVKISGSRVPGEITGNAFVNNRAAIVNQSGLPVNARENYWGTTDSTAIAALFEGEVDWRPFLTSEPLHDTAVEATADGLPARFALHLGWPNPFNSRIHLRFDLPRPAPAELRVYDLRGALVRTLVSAALGAGTHAVYWNGLDDAGNRAASGVYFVEMRAGDFSQGRKVSLLR